MPCPKDRRSTRSKAAGAGSSLEGLLIAALALTINLVGNGRVGLWDRDEPRYAVAVREMRARGDWITPSFNGQPRYHKPIFIYWVMGLGTALFGDNPYGARFGSAVAGTVDLHADLVARPQDVRTGRRPARRARAGHGADHGRRVEVRHDRTPRSPSS